MKRRVRESNPGSHWWEASALITTGTPFLLPYNEHQLETSTGYHELTYRQGPVVQSLDSVIRGKNH